LIRTNLANKDLFLLFPNVTDLFGDNFTVVKVNSQWVTRTDSKELVIDGYIACWVTQMFREDSE